MGSEMRARVRLGCAVAMLSCAGAACSHANGSAPPTDGGAGDDASSGSSSGGALDAAREGALDSSTHPTDAGAGDAALGACVTPATAQSCTPPQGTALPVCTLALTGCMDAKNPTSFAANAVPYAVNSPLWSDGAAKSRAFVLPPGGKIHVKDCMPDAGATALADCTSPSGIPNGPADTGKWEFPVGTVMIKNFLFDGKLVETRLFMHVDAATAALIQNGTDWVGYNYAWNEAQTEATVVPDARTSVQFDTGQRTVTWNYPSFLDCIGCHSAATGTLGPETDQMNRAVDGGTNQIDAFVAMGLFDDTAPTQPYAPPLVEPYANAALGMQGPPAGATLDQEARSYLGANCGFCHRPDVNDQGFDLRPSLSLYDTNLCGLVQQNGIPGSTQTLLDLAPGNHAGSATWVRMNTPVPASDPNELDDVGRMPPAGSFAVDPQATTLVGAWIDALSGCPDAGP